MKRNLAAWLMCGSLLSLSVGCANSGVVRGQNAGMPPQAGMMMGDGGPSSIQMPAPNVQMGPMYFDGPASGANCPMPCPPGTPEVWRPTHHHTWEYNPPQNLVYPPANQMPAVTQYPYYTHKGPSDFFMK